MPVYGKKEARKGTTIVLCGVCDAPARASFINMTLHSIFFSCPFCLCHGEKPGDTTVFPYQQDIPVRNLEDYEEHKKIAVEKKVVLVKNPRNEELCCGIQSPSILQNIMLHLFRSLGIDSMHCIFLGVMRQLLILWFDKNFKDEPF